jgi:hypothetical protein
MGGLAVEVAGARAKEAAVGEAKPFGGAVWPFRIDPFPDDAGAVLVARPEVGAGAALAETDGAEARDAAGDDADDEGEPSRRDRVRPGVEAGAAREVWTGAIELLDDRRRPAAGGVALARRGEADELGT